MMCGRCVFFDIESDPRMNALGFGTCAAMGEKYRYYGDVHICHFGGFCAA